MELLLSSLWFTLIHTDTHKHQVFMLLDKKPYGHIIIIANVSNNNRKKFL